MYLERKGKISGLEEGTSISKECIEGDTGINGVINGILSAQNIGVDYDIYSSSLLRKQDQSHFGGFYLPFHSPYKGISVTEIRKELYRFFFEVSNLFRLQSNLNHLKDSVVDDTLPYIEESLQNFNSCALPAGRLYNAHFLGELQYKEALPELLESGVYDDNSNMRGICMDSIGNMGDQAFDYADYISKRLYEEKNSEVKSSIADTLGKIGNVDVLPVMSNYACEIAHEIDYYISEEGIFSEKAHELGLVFQDLLFSIFNLDDSKGREVIHRVLSNFNNRLLNHFIKNALKMNPLPSTDKQIYTPNLEKPEIKELDIEF